MSENQQDVIESLRQQVAVALAKIEGLNGRFTKDQDRIVMDANYRIVAAALAACKVKDEALYLAYLNEGGYHEWKEIVSEALAATADLEETK